MERITELKEQLITDGGVDRGEIEIHLTSHQRKRRMQPYGDGMVLFHRDREYLIFCGPMTLERINGLDLLLTAFEDKLNPAHESVELQADLVDHEDELLEPTVTLKVREEVYGAPDPAGNLTINGALWSFQPKPGSDGY